MNRRILTLGLAAGLTFAAATPGMADTVLLADDMEGAIDAKWAVGDPTHAAMEPWQKSDSTAPKARGNQANGGATSYWAGMKPEGMDPATVISGQSTLTAKAPIFIPADGKTTVSFFSLFLNEGDDSGTFEAALTPNAPDKQWKKIAAVKLEPSDITNPDPPPGYCVPNPNTVTYGFEEVKGEFTAFAGAQVYVRFNLRYGSENRQTSMPCGWYVDDLKVNTTGTPGKTLNPPVTPPAVPAPVAKAAVKFGKLKASGKKATLSLTVSNAAINDATITLSKGSKRVATAKLATLAVGRGKVVIKLKKKLAKGTYKIKLTGTPSYGGKFTAKGKAKV